MECNARLRFCSGWLSVMALGVAACGALLAVFPGSSAVQVLVNTRVDPAFFSGNAAPTALEPYREWVFGVLGACMTGWGCLMAGVVLEPFRAREIWAWRALAYSLSAWFLLDTGISLYHGVTYNAVLNGILFAGFAIPLGASRTCFPTRHRAVPRVVPSTNMKSNS